MHPDCCCCCYHKFYMKLFTYYKLLQQSPQANKWFHVRRCHSGGCQWVLGQGPSSILLDHSANWTRGWLSQLSSASQPLHPRPPWKPWWAQESLTCWGPRFLGVRSAHNRLSLSQRSCQTKGEPLGLACQNLWRKWLYNWKCCAHSPGDHGVKPGWEKQPREPSEKLWEDHMEAKWGL